MRYEETARPITTVEEQDAAIAAGARIEFTACGDDYDAPSFDGGWIDETDDADLWRELIGDGALVNCDNRLRAFYPETEA